MILVTDIRKWIEQDKLYKFYKTKEWRALRGAILRENHGECAWCKARGIITAAETVHHVRYVRKYPELAMSRTYIYEGKQYANLVPLCHDCHDRAHKRMGYKQQPRPLTEERW